MARGKEGKQRRKNNRKQQQEGVTDMFNLDEQQAADENDDLPLPPGMAAKLNATSAVVEDDDDDSDEVPAAPMPKKNKKKNKEKTAMPDIPRKKEEGIKTLPLIFLILMTGTTLIPAFIYAGDFLSAYFANNNVVGRLGYRLGMAPVPRKRVMSFYEKHSPEKVDAVPKILEDYYGDYPKLIKKLERKYQDYGYFSGWEQDDAPAQLTKEYLQQVYSMWIAQWNKLAPQVLKTAARNAKYNLSKTSKTLHKAWKKTIWPMLEPIIGVPDGAEKQKRQDAYEAKQRRASASKDKKKSTRRKNREFRDHDEH